MTNSDGTYGEDFFAWMDGGSSRSAQVIVPMIVDLLAPSSVIDIGCGTGAWLAEFQRHGVNEIVGIDGAWVPPARLKISKDRFHIGDLTSLGRPPAVYDLAVCLEVAEHLPVESGHALVSFLTHAAPVVLFSAAIPGQGGEGHVNEQWLDYWHSEFAEREYDLFDVVRAKTWNDERVEPWYAQNLVVFAGSRAGAAVRSRLQENVHALPLRLVHPDIFKFAVWRALGV